MTTTINERIEELSHTLYTIAWHFSTPDVFADDIYQGIVETILITCQPTDTKSFICQKATWHAKNMVSSETIYAKYVGSMSEYQDSDKKFDIYDILENIIGDELLPEDSLLQHELINELIHVISTLDETDKYIVSMLLRGKTHEDTAKNLNISRTAVSNRIHRNLRRAFCMAGLISV